MLHTNTIKCSHQLQSNASSSQSHLWNTSHKPISLSQHPSANRRCIRVHASSVRQPKNPRDYANMDDLRAALHRQTGFQAGFSGFLNWLSSNAFGSHSQQIPQNGPFVTMYNKIIQFSKRSRRDSSYDDWEQYLAGLDPAKVSQLMALMLCSRRSLAYIARRYPPIMEMDVVELGSRLVSLKNLLPACDVALLVELQPRLFMGANRAWVERQVSAASLKLRGELPGADVDRMIEEDPLILFTDIGSGIEQMKELWGVDEQMLRNSCASHLALAIRALSTSGPPRRI